MQISFNNIERVKYLHPSKFISKPDKNFSEDYNKEYNISFQATPIYKPIIAPKINVEKSKLLRKLTEISKTNVPILTEEQLFEIIERRAHAIIRMKSRKREMILAEREVLYNTPLAYISYQQKLNRQAQLDREEKELNKIDPFEIPEYLIPPKTSERYDYKLIERFKEALNDNNFDLKSIFLNHYSELNEIKTVEELKEKYPSILIPPSVREILSQKIVKTFSRDVFERIDKAGKEENEKAFSEIMTGEVLKKVCDSLEGFGIKDVDFINNVYLQVIDDLTNNCIETVLSHRLDTKSRIKNNTPNFTDVDKLLIGINYDKFILHCIREIYLNGKKVNEITYQEGEKTIKLSDLKNSEYKFEKVSEKIKKFIVDSDRIKNLQRDYQKFTADELKSRMLHYEQTEFGYDNTLFNLFVEFEGCEFTQEDKQYLIKFLQKLDELSDKKITLEECKEFLNKSNIHPHGTNKLNEDKKREIEKAIKLEQQKKNHFIKVREELNNLINALYEKDFINEADLLSKYYPENFETTDVDEIEKVLKFFKDSLNKYEGKEFKTKILRWETYNETLKNNSKSNQFKDAIIYSDNLEGGKNIDLIGQYLLNRELIEGYPDSRKLVSEPELLDKVMENFATQKDLATRLLCKFENYKELSDFEKSSISKVLDLLDIKNSAERIILKHIIEKDYVNIDTTVTVERENIPQKRTICASAKQGLFDKYNFPNSIPFFEKFEQALPLDAPFRGGAGVKKLTRHVKNHNEKAEIKIMGHDDRLVADNEDFRFNRFDDKGIH